MKISLKAMVTVALLVFIAGCASHPPRIDCDGHLKPINAPAPVTRAGGGP